MNPFRTFDALTEARRAATAAARHDALKAAAPRVREQILSDGPVDALVSRKLITFPYPTVMAFSGAALSPAPYVMMTNRLMVVQYRDHDGIARTLLFNPSDYDLNQTAPFYAKLRKRYGDFISDKIMATRYGAPEKQLAELGLRPEDVDFIAYDHLHVQDLRRWLVGPAAVFPRAKLIVQRAEWSLVNHLHPMERVWFVPGGVEGIREDQLELLDGDAWLGRGVAIISTPGHTMGNMSLAVHVDQGRGLFLTSENAVATECYDAARSEIAGLRSMVEQLDYEFALNGNTRESSLDQYTSMTLEKELAGPSKANPDFCNFYPSSELTASLFAPGLSPTFSHGELSSGQLRQTQAARAA